MITRATSPPVNPATRLRRKCFKEREVSVDIVTRTGLETVDASIGRKRDPGGAEDESSLDVSRTLRHVDRQAVVEQLM